MTTTNMATEDSNPLENIQDLRISFIVVAAVYGGTQALIIMAVVLLIIVLVCVNRKKRKAMTQKESHLPLNSNSCYGVVAGDQVPQNDEYD